MRTAGHRGGARAQGARRGNQPGGRTRAPRAGDAGQLGIQLSRAEPGSTSAVALVRRLQATAGNRAVQQLLPLQRESAFLLTGFSQKSTDELVRSVKDDRYHHDLRVLHRRDERFGEVSVDDRLSLIRVALAQRWVDNQDEVIIEDLWRSFGDGVRPLALKHIDLWKESHAAGADLQDFELFDDIRDEFPRDVKAIVLQNLFENELVLAQEAKHYEGTGVGPRPSWQAKAEELRATAKLVQKAQRSLKALRSMRVGYDLVPVNTGHVGKSGIASGPIKLVKQPSFFNPDSAPKLGPEGNEQTPIMPWAQVKDLHSQLSAEIEDYAVKNPTIYLLIKNDEIDKVADDTWLAGQNDLDLARTSAVQAIGASLLDIRKTRGRVESGSLGFAAFAPVHQQLMGGRPSPSGVNWKQPLENWLASALVTEVKEAKAAQEFLESLGQAALFCVATYASGGLATAGLVGGLALTGKQLSDKWSDYTALKEARGTGTAAGLESVAEGDVSSAKFEAVLTTLLSVIDVAGVLKPYLAARAAAVPGLAGALAATEARKGVADILTAQPGSAKAVIERSIGEIGLKQTLASIPQGFKDWPTLIEAIPGALTASALKSIDQVPPPWRLALLERALSWQSKEQVVQQSGIAAGDLARMFFQAEEAAGRKSNWLFKLETGAAGAAPTATPVDEVRAQLGELGYRKTLMAHGGWEKVLALVGEESDVAFSIMDWRDKTLGGEFAQYMAQHGGVHRTGSVGKKFSNDYDWNCLGKDGAANVEAAVSWHVARLGMPIEDVKILLKADFFVDPRRLHRYDVLTPAARAKAVEEQTKVTQEQVYARLLARAETPEAKARVIKERQTLGIAEAPWERLSPEQIKQRERLLDDLEKDLAWASTPEEASWLASQIAREQGLVNASKDAAYSSGGAGRRFVTEREGHTPLPDYTPKDSPPEMLQAEYYAAALDQLPFLRQAIGAIRLSAGNPAKLSKAVRDFGKFQERIRSVAREAGVPDELAFAKSFNSVASELDNLVIRAMKITNSRVDLEIEFLAIFTKVDELITHFDDWSVGVIKAMKQRSLQQFGTTELRGDGLALFQEMVAIRIDAIEAAEEMRKTFFRVATAIQVGRPAWQWFQASEEPAAALFGAEPPSD